MKAFPKILVFEDYNYVEGVLEIIVSGDKLFENETLEEYSVKNILQTKLFVERKYLHPDIPPRINKNRVFTLPIPKQIPTYISQNGEEKIFDVRFDEIICDDVHVDSEGRLNIQRYNTIKEGSRIFSAFKLKVFALKKNRREEIEYEEKYEVFTKINGNGRVEISPKKDYYSAGEKIVVKAIPSALNDFVSWGKDFKGKIDAEIESTIESDVDIEVNFEKTPVSVTSITFATSRFFTKSDHTKYENGKNKWYQRKRRPSLSQWRYNDVFDFIGEALAFIIWIGILIALVYTLFSLFGWGILIIAVLFGLNWLNNRFSFIGSLFTGLLSIFSYGLILLPFFSILSIFSESNPFKDIKPKRTDNVPTVRQVNENKTTDYIHTIKWNDYQGVNYSTTLAVNSDDVEYEKKVKAQTSFLNNKQDYDRLLSNLSEASNESLLRVFDSLDNLLNSRRIFGKKRAEVLVSMVQSLPYYVLIDQTCNPLSYNDSDIRELLVTNPCLSNVQHGIQSPSEFLSNLKGDCDTRTLFLYKVLRNYDFDVIVLGSEYYKHSILGLHLPGHSELGITFEHNAKEYYVWETTTAGMELGELQYSFSDMKYWSVNLN